MTELSPDDLQKLKRLLEIEDDLTQIVEDKKAYERVGAQIRSKLTWVVGVIGLIAVMWDKIKELIKAAVA